MLCKFYIQYVKYAFSIIFEVVREVLVSNKWWITNNCIKFNIFMYYME